MQKDSVGNEVPQGSVYHNSELASLVVKQEPSGSVCSTGASGTDLPRRSGGGGGGHRQRDPGRETMATRSQIATRVVGKNHWANEEHPWGEPVPGKASGSHH